MEEGKEKEKPLKCERRTTYETEELANEAAKYFTQHEAVVYKCKWCGKYHIIFPQ